MTADADSMRDELRTLNHIAVDGTLKIRNDPRVTRVGKYLRIWSVDEIP